MTDYNLASGIDEHDYQSGEVLLGFVAFNPAPEFW